MSDEVHLRRHDDRAFTECGKRVPEVFGRGLQSTFALADVTCRYCINAVEALYLAVRGLTRAKLPTDR